MASSALCCVCEEEYIECPESATCKACYSYLRRWSKERTVAQRLQRSFTLELWSTRLQAIGSVGSRANGQKQQTKKPASKRAKRRRVAS